jgi:tRNA threonylcarbamoyladenosine biosynthesis protein TsaE
MTAATKVTVSTRSARATHALGQRLGRLLAPGDVVALVGDLGAGKTQLVRGACAGAGVRPEDVSSPSFAIVATYAGRLPVHHADLYRIGDEDELYGTGFGDLVGGDGALLVEWADRVPSALPAERLTIRLAHDERRPDVRHVELEGVGERHAELAEKLAGPPRGRGRGRKSDAQTKTRSKTKTKTKTRQKPSTSTTTSTSTSTRKRTRR